MCVCVNRICDINIYICVCVHYILRLTQSTLPSCFEHIADQSPRYTTCPVHFADHIAGNIREPFCHMSHQFTSYPQTKLQVATLLPLNYTRLT